LLSGSYCLLECLVLFSQEFCFVVFTAKPQLLMSDRILFGDVDGTIVAGNHAFTAQFFIAGSLFFTFQTGLIVFNQAPEQPDNQGENYESDQAHKKSL
jgi:hypothetical protein